MSLKDFYPGFEDWTAVPESAQQKPQIQDPATHPSPYLRAPLPLVLQYAPDTLRQSNRQGLSTFRIAPQSPSSFPAVNAAAQGVAKNTVSTATIAATPSSAGGVTSVGLTAP